MAIDFTHDPGRRSWVDSANTLTDFPVQNLPFAVFRDKSSNDDYRGGVAIGDQIVDLRQLADRLPATGLAATALFESAKPTLNDFIALGPPAWKAIRHLLFNALAENSTQRDVVETCLVPQSRAEYVIPVTVGDYTDFYTSYFHALNVGRAFGGDNYVVGENFHRLPIAYHGRSSSLVVSGSAVRRPNGQSKMPGDAAPTFGPSSWLDYEVEIGIVVGASNAIGQPIQLDDADDHIFGMCLLNDWSARDFQLFEMSPLGPFLSKNFTTTLSPWLVTMDALEPFRTSHDRDPKFEGPPDYLVSTTNSARGAFDITVEAWIETATRRSAGLGPTRLTATSFKHQHWTPAQMLTHHAVGGCNLGVGDLLGTGTISGPTADEAGALVELTVAGRQPISVGDEEGATENRRFLEDDDTVILRGNCERSGFAPIGFGECRGTIRPARDHPTGNGL